MNIYLILRTGRTAVTPVGDEASEGVIEADAASEGGGGSRRTNVQRPATHTETVETSAECIRFVNTRYMNFRFGTVLSFWF